MTTETAEATEAEREAIPIRPCRPRENDRMGQQQPPFRQAVRRGAESGHAVRRRQHGPVRPQRLYYLVQDQRVRRREQPGGIRFPMHVQCRQPRYVDHERPNDGHVPVRRSRQVHRGRAGYFRIQPARLPVRFPAPVPEKPDVRRHQCPRPAGSNSGSRSAATG